MAAGFVIGGAELSGSAQTVIVYYV